MSLPADDDILSAVMAAKSVVHLWQHMRASAKRLLSQKQQYEYDSHSDEDDEPKVKRSRAVYERPNYWDSSWGRMLQSRDLEVPGSRDAQKFRRRFRVPFPFFKDLLTVVKEKRWFRTHVGKKTKSQTGLSSFCQHE